jgi:hypothetical protein
MNEPIHKNLAMGQWARLTFCEQMGNTGSEVSRMLNWQIKDPEIYKSCFVRALELLDMTIADPRWQKRLKELVRVRGLLCAAFLKGDKSVVDLSYLNRYFLDFAMAARIKR